MKKILSLFLACTMIFSLCITVSAFDNIPIAQKKVSIVTHPNDWTKAFEVAPSQKVAQYIKYDEKITGVEVITAGFSNSTGDKMTLTLLPWKGSYASSLYETPIGKAVYSEIADGAALTVKISDPKDYSNEVMVVVSDTSNTKVGLWYGNDTGAAETKTFVGGAQSEHNFAINILVDADPEVSENLHTDPRDAYSVIPMADYDYSFGIVSQSNNDDGADCEKVISTKGQGGDMNIRGYRGNYVGYAKIDFGNTSPKAVTFRRKVMSTYNRAEIQVYIDSLNGTKIAETMFQYAPEDSTEYTEMDLQIIEEVTGVHDVYIVFGYNPLFLSTMQFSKESKPLNKDDKALAEFKPVKAEELTDMMSDTWSATDMIGRELPGYETVGEYDPEKQIIMFFWDGRWSSSSDAINLNEVSRLNPEIRNVYNTNVWGSGRYYYDESVYGYYSNYEEWTIRKQLELLSAAGVDALAMDVSNQASWSAGASMNMRRIMHEMMQDGYNVPKITYVMPFFYPEWTANTVENIYQTLHKPGVYSDTWYYWDGKPLLMAHPESIATREQGQEIMDYFTFRPGQPSYRGGATKTNNWPWLEVYPQNGYVPLKNSKYDYECVAVGVAQNTNESGGLVAMNHGDDVFGRSYTYKEKFLNLSQEYSEVYGHNFGEQWERAFELNPKAVFVTGWNEYCAGRYENWGNTPNAFPDQFNDEYSRDVEPTKGVLQDAYYYQLVANVRKFKGVRPTPTASEEKTISLDGGFDQWNDVLPEYHGFKGGTEQRNAVNHGITYKNDTGRNDIVLSKVARDTENLYFYVETAENLTPYTDNAWMRLFINTDRETTGWEGYDYVINRVSPSASKAVIEKNTGYWSWEQVGEVDYKVSGNKMMIVVPRSVIGVEGTVDIDFKWNDNMQTDGNIMDFYTNGDTAPIGRFAYRYTETTENDEKIVFDKTEGYEPSPYAKLVYNTVMALDSNFAIDRGEKVQIDPDNPEVAPKIINDKTMVPLRFFCESMDAKVSWSDESQSATITYMGKRIKVTPGSSTIRIEKQNVNVQTAPQEIDGRIYIPLRDISEALGAECFWIDPGVIIIGTDAAKNYYNNEDVQQLIKYWYNV